MRDKHRQGAVNAHVLDHAKVRNHGPRLFAANDARQDDRCLRCGQDGHTSSSCPRALPPLSEADLELARNFAGDRPDLVVDLTRAIDERRGQR